MAVVTTGAYSKIAPYKHCVFCRRINLDQYDTDQRDVVTFEPLNPVTPGHRLFVPRQHVADATEKPWVAAQVMEVAAAYARARNVDCNLLTSVGEAATQTIPHLHLHYVPRRPADGLHLPWTGQQTTPLPELEEIHGAPRPMCPRPGCMGSIYPDGTCTRSCASDDSGELI